MAQNQNQQSNPNPQNYKAWELKKEKIPLNRGAEGDLEGGAEISSADERERGSREPSVREVLREREKGLVKQEVLCLWKERERSFMQKGLWNFVLFSAWEKEKRDKLFVLWRSNI